MRTIVVTAALWLALTAGTGCTIIKRSPEGSWTYERFGGQNSVDVALTSGTLHVIINPHPETTADIINAAAAAVVAGTVKAVKP